MTESFRELRLFVAAFEERSFTAAAERENATQSGVSQHIRKLEDRFGVRLFQRGAGTVMPTPAGEEYYRHCLTLLRAQDEASRALRLHAGSLDGEARIGLMPTMTRCALAPALDRFLAAQPNAVVRIQEAYSNVLTAEVSAGALDFAIVPAFAGGTGLRLRPFLRTPEVLVSHVASGLPHLRGVRLAALPPLRLVLPGPGNTRRRTLEAYLAAHDVPVARLIELDAMLGTLDMVASAHWMAILPGIMMASEFAERRFTVSPLTEPPLGLDLVLIEPARCSPPPVAAAFLAVLEAESRRLNRLWEAHTEQ